MRRACVLCVATVWACGGGATHVTPSPSEAEDGVRVEDATPAEGATAAGIPAAVTFGESEVLAETRVVSVARGTFEAPAGFALARAEDVVRLRAPEGDLTLWFVEVEAESVDLAIERAWTRTTPGFSRAVRARLPSSPVDGWDEIAQVVYEVAPSESRTVVAVARRRAGVVAVVLLDASLGDLSRLGALINVAIGSFRIPGVERESYAGRQARPLSEELADELGRFVERALRTRKIPGAAVAVVQNGERVFSRGFGTRRVGEDAPVSPRTLFMIGSNTKPLTSLLMARVVASGRAEWTTPVRELLPGFALGDEALTASTQLQHTVCACTGLPRRDLELVFDVTAGDGWLRLLSESTPTTSFGEVFQYSNLMVAAGGFAIARKVVPRGSYADAYRTAMQREVFTPLGMRDTVLRIDDARRRDHALPHGYDFADAIAQLPLDYERGVESVAPAGSAWSNLDDMVRYVQMELRRGSVARGPAYLPEEVLLERRRARVRVSETQSYGLALLVGEHIGLDVVTHGGNNLGFSANFWLFPDHDLGVVVLTNASGTNSIMGLIMQRALELIFDGTPRADAALATLGENVANLRREDAAQIDAAPTPARFQPLLGNYENPTLGTLRLTEVEGALFVQLGRFRSRLGLRDVGGEESWVMLDPPLAGLPFTAIPSGLRIDYPQQPYDFARAE